MAPPESLSPRVLAALGLLGSTTACGPCLSQVEACLSAPMDTGDTGDTGEPEDSDASRATLRVPHKSAVQSLLERRDLPEDLAMRLKQTIDDPSA